MAARFWKAERGSPKKGPTVTATVGRRGMQAGESAKALVRFRWELGWIEVAASDEGVVGVRFAGSGPETEEGGGRALELARQAGVEIAGYLAGVRREFSVPLAIAGTGFQKAVWAALRGIPYGRTTTYGALAAALGKPRAARAVGLACAANPVPILVPCHRVVGRDSRLTGFSGGLHLKERLLALEARNT